MGRIRCTLIGINPVLDHQENILPFLLMNQDLRPNEMNWLFEHHLFFVRSLAVFEQVLNLLQPSMVLHLSVKLFQHVLKSTKTQTCFRAILSSFLTVLMTITSFHR